jgi:glucose-6-phosphate isomerase
MHHIIDTALTADITPHYDAALGVLDAFVTQQRQAPLPHLAMPAMRADMDDMRALAARMGEGATRILILATGGSSLGAQVLAQVHGALTPGFHAAPELVFCDNLDADSYDRLLDTPLQTTRFLVVSKSGGTAETMMQLGGALSALAAQGLDPAKHIGAIAGAADNALRRLADHYGLPILPHEDAIGGRFAVLTNVGLLPAIWAGGDPQAIRDGAQSVIDGLMTGDMRACPAVQGAALNMAHMQAGRMISVMLPYADRLERLTFWYRQLWAESLGKQGKGSLPVNALGPVDQHSQLQLYLDGPDDKLYTLVSHDTRGRGCVPPAGFGADAGLAMLAGQPMGNLVEAEVLGTRDALVARGRPIRHIELNAINDETIGALLMHFMLETIFTAHLLDIDAFDQPAVEDAKIRAKQYMQDMPETA